MRTLLVGACFALLSGLVTGVVDGPAADVAKPDPAARSLRTPRAPIASMAGRQESSPHAAPDPAAVMARGSVPLRRLSILLSGDVLLHNTLWTQARRDAAANHQTGYDFRPMLAGVRPAVSGADLAICHLETALGPPDGPFTSYPIFSVPPRIAADLVWAGYDACTTASNHTLDAGADGVDRTLDVLDRAGLAHAGSARTEREAATVTRLEAAGATVALLSYTYGLNGFTKPADRPWIVNLIDADRIEADAHRARHDGADVVLVALHWGSEYQHHPSDTQRELAARLLASPDIDLVYGHHAHVVQPFERIGAEWVAYGLGNHIAEQTVVERDTHEGVMARFEFTADANGSWRVTRAEYLPTAVSQQRPYRLVDLSRILAGDQSGGGIRRGAYQAAFDHIRQAVESLGATRDGLVTAIEPR